MKRFIVPEKNKLTKEVEDKGRRSVTFRLDPQKKDKIETMVDSKGKNVLKILRQWMIEDKEKAIEKKE